LMGLLHLIPEEVAGTDYSDMIKDPQARIAHRPLSTPFISIEGNKKGVRTTEYTFTIYENGKITLFNNLSDPYQQTNLDFSTLPIEDRKMLSQELGYWLKLSQDPWVEESKHPNLIDYSVNING